jgi:NAD(P)H-flavin reductase
MVPRIYRVERVRRELHDVVTLSLAPAQGRNPPFQPGQFNMLYAFGVGEVAISLSGDVNDGGVFVHTVRAVGAASGAVAAAQPGALLGVRGPFGAGWPTEAAQGTDVVIVAGGLGLAPLRPAIYAVLANRQRFGRVAVLYGARSPGDILYLDELEHWRGRPDIDVSVTVDHADADWRGNVGVVPKLVRQAGFDPSRTTAMLCGPEVMMRFTATALLEAGVAPDRIHLSMERNMKCALGLCGHCQLGPDFVCKDGPVMRYDRLEPLLAVREL